VCAFTPPRRLFFPPDPPSLYCTFAEQGFLPLHWAVNQDAPNIEVVRKLIKIFPAGAGMPSLSGNLPLHYCVSRAR
jgi:ankyrin repeat protein